MTGREMSRKAVAWGCDTQAHVVENSWYDF
jgi:hypothetical protein